jgi:rod shape-determining protein MreC
MLELLKRFSAPISFVSLLLIAAVAMVGDSRDYLDADQEIPWWHALVLEVVSPVQQMVSIPGTGVRNVWNRYLNLIDVGAENTILHDRVAELEELNLQYQEALVASGHLQRIAAMRGDLEVPLLPAQVVGLDISLWFRTVVVDRGRDHGVNAGNPIITNNGVAGLVTAASRHASKVMLLLDRQSAVDGVVQRSRTRGVVHGNGAGKLEFEFVARDGDIHPGDLVLTSGLDAVYPKGLRIGTVSEIRHRGSELIQIAILTPAVDFERLEQVFVMFHQGPTMELLYGTTTAISGEEASENPASEDDDPNGESTADVAAGLEQARPAS